MEFTMRVLSDFPKIAVTTTGIFYNIFENTVCSYHNEHLVRLRLGVLRPIVDAQYLYSQAYPGCKLPSDAMVISNNLANEEALTPDQLNDMTLARSLAEGWTQIDPMTNYIYKVNNLLMDALKEIGVDPYSIIERNKEKLNDDKTWKWR